MYQAKTELDLFLKVKASNESVGSISVSANGLDKRSEKKAIRKSYKKLKIGKKQMAKLLADAGEKLDQVNAKTSKEEYKKGKAYYDKGKYREAMRHLSKVTTGNDLKTAKDLIKKIRESQSHLAE